ncbi:MAG: glycerol-3-phosphate dehydrogenase/oxidase [Verrucomicrobia bacterium]|nr:glycerol-3-phosphate dehydrogenase/oxidase [Verrucomicrobiota bacterium]
MTRSEALAAAQESARGWDVIVIGGGATGLGTAVDAAARGYRTLLLEQNDFAKATSSRSTKLIHGGIRYLRQANVSLVRESLIERGLLFRNAPHLVRSRTFVVPNHRRLDAAYYGAGLKLYDLLAGRLSLGPSKLISREETLQLLPTLRPEGLRGGVRYLDGQFDDARLAVCLLRTLADLGGTGANYVRVVSLLKSPGRVCGVAAWDEESGNEFEIRARAVINATGVFADAMRHLDAADSRPLVTLSQGAHVVLDKSFLPGDSALMIPETDDGRVLFAIPWLNRVVVGTTDTAVAEAGLEPRPLDEEIEFLLQHASRYLTKTPTRRDILSAFAGLRPLAATGRKRNTSEISRGYALSVSSSGLITITGGKWTTYRKMGEAAVALAAEVGGLKKAPPRTRELKLHGWSEEARDDSHWRAYGADLGMVQALLQEHSDWNQALHPRLPYTLGEVVWAVRHEMARTVEDVLARRTRALILDARASLEAAPHVAALMAKELGRDERWVAEQSSAFAELARGYLPGQSRTQPFAVSNRLFNSFNDSTHLT